MTFNESKTSKFQGDGKFRKKSSSKSREATPKAPKKALGDDEESDDSYWDDSGDDSSESSSDDDPGMSLREKFLKKVKEMNILGCNHHLHCTCFCPKGSRR